MLALCLSRISPFLERKGQVNSRIFYKPQPCRGQVSIPTSDSILFFSPVNGGSHTLELSDRFLEHFAKEVLTPPTLFIPGHECESRQTSGSKYRKLLEPRAVVLSKHEVLTPEIRSLSGFTFSFPSQSYSLKTQTRTYLLVSCHYMTQVLLLLF